MLIVVLAILGLMGFGAYEAARSFIAEDEARKQAQLTSEVITDLNSALLALIDSETAERGYVITRDRAYLQPHADGGKKFFEALENLRTRLEGVASQTQSELINSLQKLGTEKLDELDRTIELVSDGGTAQAISIIRGGRGKELMDRVRVVVGQLQAYENGILKAAIERADEIQADVVRALIFLLVGVIVLFALLIFQVWRTTQLAGVEASLALVENERQKTEILARELNHRVKNLFAIVLSLIRQTGRDEQDAQTVTKKIHERVQALARAHELTARIDGASATTLRDLLRNVLSPYQERDGALRLDGPDIHVNSRQVTPLGLIANELATNAVKYGAWATETGCVTIEWERDRDRDTGGAVAIALTWRETGGELPAETIPDNQGFGSRLIEMSIAQLYGTCEKEWGPGGLKIVLFFNLEDETIS